MKNLLFFCFATTVLLVACSQQNKQQGKQQTALKDLKGLESETFGKGTVDSKLALRLLERYENYATAFPEDSTNAIDCFLKGGEVATAIKDGKRAEKLWLAALQKYPNHAKASKAMFMLAFCYENTLFDQVNAAKYYNAFLQKYPTDKLALSAQASLQNLGKSPDELVKEFEAKAK